MTTAVHGGGVQQAAAELGRPLAEVLDFSASINPLGPSPAVLQAAAAALAEVAHYPEIGAASLVAALAEHHGLAPAHFLPGNGSTPLFYHFARVMRPRRALLVLPAFSEYQRSLLQAGTEMDVFALDPGNNFQLDPAALLRRVTPATDLVLLANPGNPSGVPIPGEIVHSLSHALREQALLAIDEAFVDFAPDYSLLPRLAGHDNLYIFRSLTKFYAIPGLRAGYLAGPPAGIARLADAAEPWPLANVTIAAARAALADIDYRQTTLTAIPRLRADLAAGLTELGLTVTPAVANYLLARLPSGSSLELAAALRQSGLLIRPCGNFPPLDDRYLRLAVRSAAENTRLLDALHPFLKEGRS